MSSADMLSLRYVEDTQMQIPTDPGAQERREWEAVTLKSTA